MLVDLKPFLGERELNEMAAQWAKKKRIILNTETRYCQTIVI